MLRLLSLWERLRANFWLVPSVMALTAVALSLGAAYIDRVLGLQVADSLGWMYSGGP